MLKTEASDTKSFKLLLKIFCKSFKKIVKYNTNPIIPYLRMKNKFDFLISNNIYGLFTVSAVVLVLIAVAVAYVTYY